MMLSKVFPRITGNRLFIVTLYKQISAIAAKPRDAFVQYATAWLTH